MYNNNNNNNNNNAIITYSDIETVMSCVLMEHANMLQSAQGMTF